MPSNTKVVAACILLCLAATAVFLQRGLNRESSLSRIREAGVIRIGYAIEEPFAFLDAKGRPTGESIEEAREIVRLLGVPRIEWRLTEFGSLIADLESGRFDVIASGLFITSQRGTVVAFSEPVIRVQQALLVRRGNPLSLHSYEGIVRAEGVKVAVIRGSIEETLFHRLGMPEERLVSVPDARTGRAAVETGVASGMALSAPAIRVMGRADGLGGTEPASPFDQTAVPGMPHLGYCAFAFRRPDRSLLAAWNGVLAAYVGSEDHRRTIATFGFGAGDLPGIVSTKTILEAGASGRAPLPPSK